MPFRRSERQEDTIATAAAAAAALDSSVTESGRRRDGDKCSQSGRRSVHGRWVGQLGT